MCGFVLRDIALICQYCECTNDPQRFHLKIQIGYWCRCYNRMFYEQKCMSQNCSRLFFSSKERDELKSAVLFFIFPSNFTDRIICNPVFWKELVHAQQFKSFLLLFLSKTAVLLSAHSPLLLPLPVLPSLVRVFWVPAAVALWIPSPDAFSSVEESIT